MLATAASIIALSAVELTLGGCGLKRMQLVETDAVETDAIGMERE